MCSSDLALDEKPVLHGDNGSTVKATTVLAMLHWLGIKASHSRPRVSDDNAFIEAFFRTTKYRPQFPSKGFADLEAARCWVTEFVAWYNNDHKHSGIRYVSPAQRHAGEDRDILSKRHALYTEARAANPRRWARHTRNWQPIEVVQLTRFGTHPIVRNRGVCHGQVKVRKAIPERVPTPDGRAASSRPHVV